MLLLLMLLLVLSFGGGLGARCVRFLLGRLCFFSPLSFQRREQLEIQFGSACELNLENQGRYLARNREQKRPPNLACRRDRLGVRSSKHYAAALLTGTAAVPARRRRAARA